MVDDREPVRERVGLVEVVRRQEDGGPALTERADLVPHARSSLRVEPRRGLVEEEHARAMDDPEADIEAALHAAGVRRDGAVGGGAELEHLEDLGGTRLRLPCRHAVETRLEDELAATGLGRVGRAPLRHVSDAAADLRGVALEVHARDPRLARGRADERREHAQRRGLAGPVGAEEAEDLASADLEVDASDGLDGRALRLERLA